MKSFTFFLTLFLAFTIVTANFGKRDTFATIKKRALKSGNGDATWFEAVDLENSACYGRNGLRRYDAKSSDFIGAMAMRGQSMCYKCIEITNERNGKSVTVKIIDKCAGCEPNKDIDLTKEAFTQLADLDEGRIPISWKACACPRRGRFPKFEIESD